MTVGMSSPCDTWADRLSAKAYFGGNGQPVAQASCAFGLAIYPNPGNRLRCVERWRNTTLRRNINRC
jgi:hypothetical protein